MADVQSNIKVSIDTTDALASIKNLQRQISAFHTSMAKSGAAANAVAAQMQQSLINSVNATGKFSAQMRTIKTTTESFTNSLEKNKFTLGEYFRYAGGASKTFGKLFKTEFDTINKVARENVKDLQTQYIKLGRDANGAMKAISVRPLALDMNDLATKTMIASEKQALLNQLLKQGSTNLLNFGKNTQWAGRQLMVGFTIPLVTLGTAAAKTFMDMEKQAIRFKKVYGDLFTSTTESTAALDAIKNLGKEFTKYGVAVSDTVGLAAEAAAAGFKGLDLQRQTAAATRLSILGQVESQKALETTIALQNAFSMSSEDLAKNIDFLNAVENQTVLSLDDMSTAIPKAAPVIQQLGGDVKDLAFFMTAMKEGGINASEGANALKSGLASMINPTGKASAMLESLGINIKKIVVDNRGDLKKTVIDFATALNKLDPLNRAQAIEQLFGKFQFARLSTLFANVTKDGTQASRVLDLAGASIQDLAALAEKELGMTSESAMNKFRGSVERLKLSLAPVGEEFLKVITPIAEFVTKILDKFNDLGSGTKKIIVVLTTVIAGLGPVLLMTFGLLMNGLANIIKGFTFMKSLFNKTGQSTATLGTEVKYMTIEQRNAAAVAASLDQIHKNLAQTFTSEAASVDALTRAYQRSVAAQSQFMPTRVPLGRGSITKRAKGKPTLVGGTGNQDSELALLMPGETVIPTAMSRKYAPLINGMIADNIPGYRKGLGTGTAVDIPGGFAAAHFGGSSYMTGTELLKMVEGIDTAYAKQIRKMVTELNGFGRKFTVFSNEVIGTSTELNRAVGKTGSGKTAPIALAKRDLIGSGAATRDIELQRQLEAAGVPIEEIRAINKKVTSSIEEGFSKLGNKATVTAEDLDKLVDDAYSAVSKTDDRVDAARKRMKNITAVTDPRNDSRVAASRDPYTKYRKSGAYYAGMERSAGEQNVPYQRNARFKITNAMAASVGLSSAETAAIYNQMNDQAKIALSKLKGDVAAFSLEFEKQAQAAGLKIGNSYKVGLDKSGIKDIYVESRERKSPHRLAAKDGRDDAVAYVKARRRATRAQGPVPISIVPVSTIDPRVIPFSDINTQILPSAGFDSQAAEGPMYGPRKPTRYDKTFGKAAGKLRVAGARFSNRGMGMGLSTAGLLASQMIPGTAGNVVSTISTVGFALSALEPAISGLIAKFGMARIALVGSIATAGLSIVAGMAMFKNAAKNAAEEIIDSAKREAEARAGSSRAIEQFAKTFNKALPSAREFSRNNRQSIAGSGTLVDQYAKDYATKGNISAQIINQAALKGKESGINAIAMDVANKAAIFGLSPEDIAANIKAASDLVGADQVKVTMAVQKLLDPNGKDILKEPLSIDARINFLNKQSDPVIKALDNKITDIENIDFGKRNNIPGLDTKFDYKSLKEAAGKQAEINKNYGGNWWGNIKGATQQGIRLFTSNSLADMALTVRSFDDLKRAIDSSLSPQTNNVVKEFSDVESTLQSTTTQLSIAFMQQTESLALLNGLYADGKITKEQYDAQMQISAENFDSLEKSSVKLIKQLMKIDKSGGLADAAIKDLGDQALATLKKSNPELFDKITESFTKLGRSAKVSIYMAYARGSLTIMDLALIPEIVKKISGQTFEMALKIIADSELSAGGKAVTTSLRAQAELELARASAAATKAQKTLDVSAQVAADKRVAKAKAVLAQAKKDEAEAAKVNQTGALDTDLNKYKDVTNGSKDAKTAEEKYLEVLQKEIDALKAKRDAQKDANDEVQREIDLKMKLQDLANQAVEAKISGNYLKAAMLTQESQNIKMKYNQETELRKKDAEIARLEARYKAIQDGAKLTSAETAKIPKKAAGGAIRGAGTGTSDSIPAYLSNGEYVIRAASVNKYGTETFDALNAGRFAIGGIAGVQPGGSTGVHPGGSIGVIGGNAKTTKQRKTVLETPYDSAKRLYQESNKKVVKIPVPPIRANFATNSYKLNKEQREELKSVAQQLLKYNFKSMVVQGHADSRGGVDNDLLSLNRAKATAAYLAKLVPGTSFIPVGHGIYKPLVPNTSSENMALNRRAELFLPDKYKTIYPDFNPKKHTAIMTGLGRIVDSPSVMSRGVLGHSMGGLIQKFAKGGQVGSAPHSLGMRSFGSNRQMSEIDNMRLQFSPVSKFVEEKQKQQARKNKNLSYYESRIDDPIKAYSDTFGKTFTRSPFGIFAPITALISELAGVYLQGKTPTFGKDGIGKALKPTSYESDVSSLMQGMIHPYAEIAKGSATKGDWVNAGLSLIPGAGFASGANKLRLATAASKALTALPSETRVALISNSKLRSNFVNLKKEDKISTPEFDKARYELALSDALKAAKKNNFTPLPKLKDSSYDQLVAENRKLPETMQKSIKVQGKDFVFKFHRGDIPADAKPNINTFIEGLKEGKANAKNFGGQHQVEIVDPATGSQAAWINYDPVTGYIHYRGTNVGYRGMKLSELLYNEAASITRIRHSDNLTDMGRPSAIRIGGFMADDPFYGAPTSVTGLKQYIDALMKIKKSKKPKPSTGKSRSGIGSWISNHTPSQQRPTQTSQPSSGIGSWTNNNDRFNDRDSIIGWQNDRGADLNDELRNSLRPETVQWFGSSYRTSKNFPYGPNGYIEPMALPELERIIAAENAARAGRTRTANASNSFAMGGLINKFANGGMVINHVNANKYKLPSYEVGSSYIPQDQIAQLHKGERVLTAQENKNFSASGPITNNITINGADKNAKQIAREVMVELERAQKKNNKTNMVSN